MKLLNVLYELRFSGVETMLESAAPFFNNRKINSFILATGPNLGPFASKLRKKGYKLAHIRISLKIKNLYLLFRFYYKEKFDVVHIYLEKGSFVHELFAKIANSKCVIVRSYVDVYSFDGIKRWRRIIERLIARKILKVRNISIGPSVYACELKKFKNPSEILLDWIDTDFFRPPEKEEKIEARKKLGINLNQFVISSIGTCNKKKNHTAVINAVLRLKERIPNILFLHRGTGPDTENEKQYVSELGLYDHVIFLEYLDNVRDVLWSSDIFCMTSLYEGLGNVNQEAMACGVPVVLYDVDGIRDLNFGGLSKGGFWVTH